MSSTPSCSSIRFRSPLTAALMWWSILGMMAPWQSDSFWHLRTGELIVSLRSVPLIDTLSWTHSANAFWPNHEWLSQVLLYATYSVGGFYCVQIGAGVLMALAAFILSQILKGSHGLRAVLLFLISPCVAPGVAVRPQLFTLLGIPLLFWLLSSRRFRYIPLLFFVWVQLHGGFFVGILLMFTAFVAALITRSQDTRVLGLISILSVLSASISPMGFHSFVFPFTSVARAKLLGITEWNPIDLAIPGEALFALGGGLLVGFLAIECLLSFKKASLPHSYRLFLFGLSYFLLFGVSLTQSRSMPLAALLGALAAGEIAATKRPELLSSHYFPRWCQLLIACNALGAAISILLWGDTLVRWSPLTPDEIRAIPSGPSPRFNSYNLGGYLLWFLRPEKVFVDSRHDPYQTLFLQNVFRAEHGEYQPLFSEFRIRSAVVEHPLPLKNALLRDGWIVMFSGPHLAVLTAPENP